MLFYLNLIFSQLPMVTVKTCSGGMCMLGCGTTFGLICLEIKCQRDMYVAALMCKYMEGYMQKETYSSVSMLIALYVSGVQYKF